MSKKPVVLTIIDGLGLSEQKKGNAFALANTPFLDSLMKDYPWTRIKASGAEVGLPDGQIGNSEVGHLNIGAGTIVYTGLSLIRKTLDDGTFYKNEAFLKSIKHAKKNNSTVHVMGLLSPGGVHSLEEHAFEILKLLHQEKVEKVMFHAFLDGRDVAPRSVKPSLERIIKLSKKYNFTIGTISGRLYAMDRDAMFEKTEKAYEGLRGNGVNTFEDPIKYIDDQYSKGLNDEFLEVGVNKNASTFLQDNDSVIFFNFRPDRARQLAHLIVGSELYKDKPKNPVKNVQLTTMMKYEKIDNSDIAFDSMEIKEPIGKVFENNNLKQLRIAETQKYAHVTFFMDGGKVESYKGMEQILIESPKVDDFSVIPEMSAREVTQALLPKLETVDAVIMNFANPDMVGHTGNLEAAIKAVEVIDEEVKKIYDKLESLGGTMFIIADHGNAEEMINTKGEVVTKHTTSDVPLIVTDKNVKLKSGKLGDISPTILDYMGIKKPKTMDLESLIIK